MIERRRTSLGRPGAHVILRDVLPPPVAAESAEPAGWAQARYEWGGPWVTREVGLGFEAYVRVLHPYGEGEDAETWAEVAAAHGKVMHPAAHWDEITADGPWNPRSGYDANRNGGVYLEGNLPQPILRAVCDVLRRHTATPDVCFFAVWDGWGWDTAVTVTATRADTGAPPTEVPHPDPAVRLDPNAPRFSVPARDFLLYQGKVEQAIRIGGGDYYPGSGFFWEQSPTLMWPADHAWYLSTEVDAEYTVIGCTRAAAEDLVSASGIEATIVSPDAPAVSDINQ